MPDQTVNHGPSQPAGQVGSVRPNRGVHQALRADVDDIGARVRRECAEQGLPEKVEDPVMLAKVVTLAFEGLATPSR